MQDSSAAAENILVAAGLGLGVAWIGIYPPLPGVIAPVKEILRLPEQVTPLSMAHIGYPAEERAPADRHDERRICWQEYGPKRRSRVKNAKKR